MVLVLCSSFLRHGKELADFDSKFWVAGKRVCLLYATILLFLCSALFERRRLLYFGWAAKKAVECRFSKLYIIT